MQMRKILCSPLLAFDSAHVKFGVWTWPKSVKLALTLTMFMPVYMFLSSKIISRRNAAINRNFHLKFFCLNTHVETFWTSKRNFLVLFISRGVIAVTRKTLVFAPTPMQSSSSTLHANFLNKQPKWSQP